MAPPDSPPASDDDELDGCELDFTEDPDDDLTASLRALSPTGDPAEVEAMAALFGGAGDGA